MGHTATADLPFVQHNDDRINFWAPERDGDYALVNARGRDYAEALLRVIRETQNPTIFGSVIRAIVAGGVYGPVEIGFCHALGVELVGLV